MFRRTNLSPAAGTADLRLLVLGFSAGVLAVQAFPGLPGLPWVALLALSVLPAWRGRAVWAACVLGMLWTAWLGQQYLDRRWPAARHGEDIVVRGVIISLPERAAGTGDERPTWRFEFAPFDDIGPQRLRVSWYRADAEPRGGECWRFLLRMRTPHGSVNPGGFDYEGWLLRKNIGATASVREAEPCGAVEGYRVLRVRQRVAERIRTTLGERMPAALTLALTVGDTAGLGETDWDRFRRTGTNHLIAISGFHLAIVSGCAFFLLRWAWSLWPRLCLRVPAQRVGLCGCAVVATAYALISGMGTPVTRALIMLLVLVAAALSNRLHQPGRAIACAWGLILVFDPFAVLSPGLWLSFGAVAAILYLTLGRARPPPTWRMVLVMQLLLSLLSMPLTLYFFQGLTWLSPAVNLLAVPAFSVLTPIVLLAVLLSMLTADVGTWGLVWAGRLLNWADRGLDWAAGLVPHAWLPASAEPAALALAGLAVVLLFAPRGVPLRPLALVCVLPLLWPRAVPADGLVVTALDVGQGLAVVVRTPGHTLVYDAGPAFDDGFDAGRSVVVPFLMDQGVRRVDRLVLSHDHNDHAGGVDAVRRMLTVADEIGTAQGRPCVEGEHWEWDGVRFELLHPHTARGSDNELSCVLKVSGPYAVLLPGDIERRSERRLLADRAGDLAAEVLLAPHHGSRTSSSEAFVAAVRPALVVHSAGWRSRFGHPRPEVVERYADINAAQYVTGVVGAVTIRRDSQGRLRVEEHRRRHARWWNAAAEP